MAKAYGAGDRRCDTCGAEIIPGLAGCNYCRRAYAGVQQGPKCPGCSAVNTAGAMACGRCRSPMAQSCIFCGAASPLDYAACRHCREAFAGAPQRKQQREEAYKQQQYMHMAQTGISTAGQVIASGAANGLLDSVGDLFSAAMNSVGD